jgi:hypothetical protein
MILLKGISKPQHCQSLAFSWWGTPKPLGFSFWGLPVVRHHWLRGLLVCPNWRMWSRRRFGIFGMTHLKKPCIEHPNGSLVGSLAKSGERRLHKCGPLILCYHLRPTLRLARGGGCIRHQDARMVPHKLIVYHDAKLATNHKTDIHIDYMCVYLYISNYI